VTKVENQDDYYWATLVGLRLNKCYHPPMNQGLTRHKQFLLMYLGNFDCFWAKCKGTQNESQIALEWSEDFSALKSVRKRSNDWYDWIDLSIWTWRCGYFKVLIQVVWCYSKSLVFHMNISKLVSFNWWQISPNWQLIAQWNYWITKTMSCDVAKMTINE
jgi:hypothetical protein